jgi:hypothetical protein
MRLRIVGALALLLSFLSLPADAQSWSVRGSSSADLWYHAVALTGYDRLGAAPLYAPGYAASVRRSREQRGVGPTPIEREADGLREAFLADSAFEILHFVPLYFPLADVDELLAAVAVVARQGMSAARGLGPRAQFGAAALAATLQAPAERAVLGRFAAAAREEWLQAYRDERGAEVPARSAAIAAAARTWDERVFPRVGQALRQRALAGGVVLVVPALGPDGRIFAGDPASGGDNLVAVHLDLSPAAAGQPAWLALREMSYTIARERLGRAGQLPSDPPASEPLIGRAATRLGAQALAGDPAAVSDYQRALLSAAGLPAPSDPAAAFRAAFPLSPGAVRALEITD